MARRLKLQPVEAPQPHISVDAPGSLKFIESCDDETWLES